MTQAQKDKKKRKKPQPLRVSLIRLFWLCLGSSLMVCLCFMVWWRQPPVISSLHNSSSQTTSAVSKTLSSFYQPMVGQLRHEKATTMILSRHHQQQAVFLWPPDTSKARRQHIFIDGTLQSPRLRLIEDWKTEPDAVWILDMVCHPLAFALFQEALVFRKQRQLPISPDKWRVVWVDYGDFPRMHRCWEEVSQQQLTTTHTQMLPNMYIRSLALNRRYDRNQEWIRVGTLYDKIPHGMFGHTPFAVRTDTVEQLQAYLRERHSLSLADAVETTDRPIDVSHFWPLQTSDEPSPTLTEDDEENNLEAYDTTNNNNTELDLRKNRVRSQHLARFRYRVSQVLHSWERQRQARINTTTNTWIGLAGRAAKKGRSSVEPDYIAAMVRSKIIVVAQRDKFEDHYRLMEALAGSGACVFTDVMYGLPHGLRNGTHIVVFGSQTELRSLLDYYLEHYDERLRIAKQGRWLAMTRHRSWHRMEEIVFGEVRSQCQRASSNWKDTDTMVDESSCPWTVHANGGITAPVLPPFVDNASVVVEQDEKNSQKKQKSWKTHIWSANLNNTNKTVEGRPLVFGAGQAGTGSRTMFEAACRLGVPSVHFHQHCLGVDADDGNRSPGWQAHQTFLKTFLAVKNCGIESQAGGRGKKHKLHQHNSGEVETTKCPMVDAAFLQRMHDMLDIIISSPEVDGLFGDAPYPHFTSYVLEAAEKIRGVKPIVLLTERTPAEWAASRLEPLHDSNGLPKQMLCRPVLLNRSTQLNLQIGAWEVGGPFDVDTCYKHARQIKNGTSNLLWRNDMFILLKDLVKHEGRGGAVKQLEYAMDSYQQSIRPRAQYVVDLKTHQPHLSAKVLAKKLAQNQTTLCQLWATWKS